MFCVWISATKSNICDLRTIWMIFCPVANFQTSHCCPTSATAQKSIENASKIWFKYICQTQNETSTRVSRTNQTGQTTTMGIIINNDRSFNVRLCLITKTNAAWHSHSCLVSVQVGIEKSKSKSKSDSDSELALIFDLERSIGPSQRIYDIWQFILAGNFRINENVKRFQQLVSWSRDSSARRRSWSRY